MTQASRAPALREMLEAVVERRKARAAKARGSGEVEVKVYSAAELFAGPLLPRWRVWMESAEEDGVMQSLYASIREEGWRAFAEGGLKAMHDLSDRACGNNGRLAVILDHRWDGIGTNQGGHWVT